MEINETHDTGKDNQHNAAGKDEQSKEVNSDDIGAGHKATGTDGTNNEKADNTAENAKQVREQDDSEGEE